MPDPREDPSLDDLLRAVPLPDGLAERLRAEGGWSDAAIDRTLGAVNVPAEMLARLRGVPSDEELDDSIRAVPIPFGLLKSLKSIIRKRTALQRLGRIAIAASIFCALTATFWSIIAVSLSISIVPEWPPRMLVGPGPDLVHNDAPLAPDISAPPAPAPVTGDTPPEAPANNAVVTQDVTPPEPTPEVRAEQRRQENLLLSRSLPLAAPYREADLTGDLEMVAPFDRFGIAPSMLRGFDRKFLMKHNTQPVVALGANPALAACSVQLATGTASFDLWRKRIAEKRLPDAGEVRVEDFLAAVRYPGAPSGGEARIVTAAGASPWSDTGAKLLQITVQAGTQRPAESAGTHLVVALDASQSMGSFGRLDRASWALWRTIERLEPQDRLSLTAFRGDAWPVVENASHGSAAEYRAALKNVHAAGSANVFAGLREALNLAIERAYSGERPSQVVLITDDRPVVSETVDVQVSEALRGLAARGLPLHVIDLGNSLDPSALLERWAAAGKGTYTVASSPQAVERALQNILAGGTAPGIAAGALRVKFNPQTVAAYRLLGQEATAAGGLSQENVKTNLPAGETATALFEVWLKPGASDDVASAELDYTVGETGSRQTVRQRISRVQFAPTWAESPLALQQAALVAETAEILRNSPFAPNKSRSLKPVLEAAEKVNLRLAEWPEWQRFVRLVEQSEAVRTHAVRP